jgi:hypothetical protein
MRPLIIADLTSGYGCDNRLLTFSDRVIRGSFLHYELLLGNLKEIW